MQPGTARVELVKLRPWEQGNAPADRFVVTLEIESR
jgi:hypothetical protein